MNDHDDDDDDDDDDGRLPRDFLDFATKRSTEQHADRRTSELSSSLPDARNAAQSPQIVVSSPSTVDDDDDDGVASKVDQPGRSVASVDGRGSRHVDRLKVRAAAAAVRRQRRSNYDNVESEDQNDEEDGGQASRRTTMSSARTEYSPPWDADRWRFLVDTAGRMCQDDVRRSRESCNGEMRRTGTLERPEQVCQSINQSINQFI